MKIRKSFSSLVSSLENKACDTLALMIFYDTLTVRKSYEKTKIKNKLILL